MAELKRKSMLSRLADVADAVTMLFGQVACPPSPSGSSSAVRARRAIPLEEAGGLVAKSSKISLSSTEATGAIKLLCELCPDYCGIKRIDSRDWLCASGKGMDLRACKEAIRSELIRTM